jgi:hypothetical protein
VSVEVARPPVGEVPFSCESLTFIPGSAAEVCDPADLRAGRIVDDHVDAQRGAPTPSSVDRANRLA